MVCKSEQQRPNRPWQCVLPALRSDSGGEERMADTQGLSRLSQHEERPDAGHGDGMTKAALEATRLALLAEGEGLEQAHRRLRFTPLVSPEHAAHRERMRRHNDRVRAYRRKLARYWHTPADGM